MFGKRRRGFLASTLATGLLVALSLGVGLASPASATDYSVGLHNTTAGAGECPTDAALGTDYWHFVAPPKSATDFQSITLQLDGAWVAISDWIEEPLAGDAYVAVPSGYTLESLQGGMFLVSGGTGEDVRLSHTCTSGSTLDEHLTVTKTASTTFTRTHSWTLDKSVDKTAPVKLYIDGSGDTTANYRVAVGYGGATDSGWTVSGTVTVVNDGDLDANITSIVDTMTLGGTTSDVALTCDGTGTLVVDATRTCTYSVGTSGATAGTNAVAVTTDADVYTDSADVTWSSTPGTEIDESVSVSDLSDLTGAADGPTFTAPNGGNWDYSVDLAYDDYGQAGCGDHVYGNTATLTGSDSGVLDTDDASLTVEVQCLVFQGETAWAQGPKFNPDGGGNWAMYVPYAGSPKTVDLLAGQFNDAGDVSFSGVQSMMVKGQPWQYVTITVTMSGDWEFDAVGGNLKVQGYVAAPSGNPSPGRFDSKKSCTGTVCSINVPYKSSSGTPYSFYAVHVDTGHWIPDPSF